MPHNADKDKWLKLSSELSKDLADSKYGFMPTSNWFDRVEEFHQNIRDKLLGGVRKTFPIEVKDAIRPLSSKIVDEHANRIINYLPSYFSTYNFNKDILRVPHLDEKHKAYAKISVSKHIKTYMDKFAKVPPDDPKYKEVLKILSDLGTDWARAKTQKMIINVTFSTDPRAFTLLGHYGPDTSSCFRQGGQNNKHKYILGQSEDTFVVILTSEEFTEEMSEHQSNLCRLWGFADPSYQIINLCNYYPKAGEHEGNLRYAIKEAAYQLIGLTAETTTIVEKNVRIPDGSVYLNQDSKHPVMWSIAKIGSNIPVQSKNMNLQEIPKRVSCTKCGKEASIDTLKVVDIYSCCPDCFEKANKCEATGYVTFTDLIKVHKPNNDGFQMICSNALNGRVGRCEIDKEYWYLSDMIPDGRGILYSKFNIDKVKMGYCPVCNVLYPNSELSKHDGFNKELCANCISLLNNHQKFKQYLEKLKKTNDKSIQEHTITVS